MDFQDIMPCRGVKDGRLVKGVHFVDLKEVGDPADAAAAYSEAGRRQVAELVAYYMVNADRIRKAMTALGYACIGGENSPYIWVSTGQDAWAFFDMLLEKAGVVCTPGAGFGSCGQGFIRISAFNSRENVSTAIDRIRQALSS